MATVPIWFLAFQLIIVLHPSDYALFIRTFAIINTSREFSIPNFFYLLFEKRTKKKVNKNGNIPEQ